MDRFIAAFTTAFSSGDPAVLAAALAPGAVLWHNDDGVEVDARSGVEGIRGLVARVEGLRVDVTQVERTSKGGVVRFTVRGTVRDSGRELAARNCVFVDLDDDGRVLRMDEYVDPTFPTQLGA